MTQLIIGVTGRICSGKDTVADYLSENGFTVLDYDRMNHEVLSSLSAEISEAFPGAVVSGEVDRKKLASIVFPDKNELRKLESITYPVLVERTYDIINGNPSIPFVLNCPLLARIGLDSICTFILFVDAPYQVRLERFIARNHQDKAEFDRRDSAQEDILPSGRVHIIDNSGDLQSLLSQVDSVLHSYILPLY